MYAVSERTDYVYVTFQQGGVSVTKILTFTNVKGGVLKTTSTVNLGYGLARAGKQVLILDMDPQCNTTYTLTGALDDEPAGTLYEVLIPQKDAKSIADIVQPTRQDGLLLAPGSILLSSADLEMAGRSNRERVLAKAMRQVSGYDYILIDTQPSLGLLTVNAILACTNIIIPVALTIYGLLGIRLLMASIEQLRENMEMDIPIFGVIACLADTTNNSKERLAQVREYFGEQVFTTVIPRNVKVEEANDKSMSLYDYAPESAGAKAYTALVEEVIRRAE